MLVTRGLGGYTVVTAGLGGYGGEVLVGSLFETPGEFYSRLYEEGLYFVRPLYQAQRIAAHQKIRDREEGYRRTGG